MPVWLVITNLIIGGLVVLSILLCQRMANQNHHPFLRPFLYFIILDAIMTAADVLLYLLPVSINLFPDKIIYYKYTALLIFLLIYLGLYELSAVFPGNVINLWALGYNVPFVVFLYFYEHKMMPAVKIKSISEESVSGGLTLHSGLLKRPLEIIDLVITTS
jgi:hypothetical protein